jgi:hypothetical protein
MRSNIGMGLWRELFTISVDKVACQSLKPCSSITSIGMPIF